MNVPIDKANVEIKNWKQNFSDKIETGKIYMGRVWNSTYRKPLAMQTVMVILNCTIIASKAFKKFPLIIGNLAATGMKFSGLMWIDDYVDDIHKCALDLKRSCKQRKGLKVLYTAIKTSVKVADLFLVCTGTCVVVTNLLGYHALTKKLYTVMTPIGLVSLFSSVALDLVAWSLMRKLAQDLPVSTENPLTETPFSIEILGQFKYIIEGNDSPKAGSKSSQDLAADIVLQMNSYGFFKYRKNSENVSYQELHKVAMQNCFETKLAIFEWICNYISMIIITAYPNTLLQSSLGTLSCLQVWFRVFSSVLSDLKRDSGTPPTASFAV